MRVKDVFDPGLAAEPGQGVPARGYCSTRAKPGASPHTPRIFAQQRMTMRPDSEAELSDMVKAAAALQIPGGGTRGIGRATGAVLATTGLCGVQLYEPGALTLVARAGTPVGRD